MSNPFPNRVEAICVSGPGERWALLLQDAVLHSAMTEAQAKYAAKAINQHEAMVAMLQTLHESVANGAYGALCPGCGQCVNHAPNCALTVLLAEEVSP